VVLNFLQIEREQEAHAKVAGKQGRHHGLASETLRSSKMESDINGCGGAARFAPRALPSKNSSDTLTRPSTIHKAAR
jgi:hypothetical protein